MFPCLYDHVPKPGPKICACECHKPKPVLLVDISIAKIDQTADAAKLKPEVSIAKDDEVTKSAAQIFMEVRGGTPHASTSLCPRRLLHGIAAQHPAAARALPAVARGTR